MTTEEALRTLEIVPPVTEGSLKAAYRILAKRFHPDRYASFDRQVWASEKFIRVKEAYDHLRRTDATSLRAAENRGESRPAAADAPPRASVFDHYSDQSDFTSRDFIAWLVLWRLGRGALRMLLKPLTGVAIFDAPQFQAAMGCAVLVPLVLLGVLMFPVVSLLVICFGLYVLLQKALFAMMEQACGMKIGPDSQRLAGQLAYLGILALCAGLAVPFANYALSIQQNRDWITETVVWTFTGTLVLTWLMECALFLKARWLRRKLGADLESALALLE